MNDPHFAMSIYEEAGDVYFKGHRNQMASLPFYRVPVINHYFFVYTLMLYQNFPFEERQKVIEIFVLTFAPLILCCTLCSCRMAVCRLQGASRTSIQSSDS